MQETEVKFHIQDLNRLEARLEQLGAIRIQERVLERNLRFDLPGGGLRREGRVLRLRHDTHARLTYKGASQKEQGILSREEIEFVVEDFEKAKQFLEALGYHKQVYYEKQRTTYELKATHVMLDELPYGSFVEIEGENAAAIRAVAEQLNLNWDTAVSTSYVALFERVRKALKLPVEDLSFENFTGVNVEAADMQVHTADQ